MNHNDNSDDFSLPASGSHLLSESPVFGSSHTASADGDLSLSELSLGDRTVTHYAPSTPGKDDDDDDDDDDDAAADAVEGLSRPREDKLQSDLFILKKLNTTFSLFNEALDNTGSANERLAQHLDETDALLNKYVRSLARAEEFTRLVFDEEWQGADADEQILEEELRVEREKAQREEEERRQAAEREQERLEKELLARQEQEEKERLAREKAAKGVSRSGVRGVRGTRASMRGMRGNAPPSQTAVISSRGRIVASTSNGTSRPTSSMGRGARRS